MEDAFAAQVCLRDAWPALETADLGGWLLRAGHGGYNRINSVWPGRFSGALALEEAIDRAEASYAARGLAPRFQILGIAKPADLDRRLEARGYRSDTQCSDLWKPVGATTIPADTTVSPETPEAWITLYGSQQEAARVAELPVILSRLPPQRGSIIYWCAGEAVAVARVGRVGDDVAVDCVMTHPDHRRRGAAEAMMQAAEAWAFEVGARRLLLSVVDENTGAVALYTKLGYRRLAPYHYRFKPV